MLLPKFDVVASPEVTISISPVIALLLAITSSCMTTFRASSQTTYFLLQILKLLHAYQTVTPKNVLRS
ncbi:hypothetical protein K503DRAFT_189428 [Rhizopogon vinicolor AM-OR11-026]|uniref:Uncharacterized protein n=1 Tax=Rhizopogon vinicolor AM-OR11-026 TaxID=1314800 RepID=A0A1B7MZJ5_9AGAM|nr:hypothetical protein K503DRAFT_189428 [Rhizopogon vinicolor AM-OR11-026]